MGFVREARTAGTMPRKEASSDSCTWKLCVPAAGVCSGYRLLRLDGQAAERQEHRTHHHINLLPKNPPWLSNSKPVAGNLSIRVLPSALRAKTQTAGYNSCTIIERVRFGQDEPPSCRLTLVWL